jgi:hypothetical protein
VLLVRNGGARVRDQPSELPDLSRALSDEQPTFMMDLTGGSLVLLTLAGFVAGAINASGSER